PLHLVGAGIPVRSEGAVFECLGMPDRNRAGRADGADRAPVEAQGYRIAQVDLQLERRTERAHAYGDEARQPEEERRAVRELCLPLAATGECRVGERLVLRPGVAEVV